MPVPYANLTNPQTLNLYSIVADDPESFADLDGHAKITCNAGLVACNSLGNALKPGECGWAADGGGACHRDPLKEMANAVDWFNENLGFGKSDFQKDWVNPSV